MDGHVLSSVKLVIIAMWWWCYVCRDYISLTSLALSYHLIVITTLGSSGSSTVAMPSFHSYKWWQVILTSSPNWHSAFFTNQLQLIQQRTGRYRIGSGCSLPQVRHGNTETFQTSLPEAFLAERSGGLETWLACACTASTCWKRDLTSWCCLHRFRVWG